MPQPPLAADAALPLAAPTRRRPCRRRAAYATLGVAALAAASVAASSGGVVRAAPGGRPMAGAPRDGNRAESDATSSTALATAGDGLTPVAHLGGRLRGLAVDGATAYVGDGVDIVQLHARPDGQLTAVRRIPLPDVVTALVLAPERDRLYATAGDAVYALDGALGQQPHVVDSVALPLAPARTIAAQGDWAFVRVRSAGTERTRCVAAVRFAAEPGHAEVGAPACQPVPDWLPEEEGADDIAFGEGVLAVSRSWSWFTHWWYSNRVALFDVAAPGRPRYVGEVEGNDVSATALFGRRLWVADDTVRSYDLVGPDALPVLRTEWHDWGRVFNFVRVDGEVWIAADGYGVSRPSPTGEPDPVHGRAFWGCEAWEGHLFTASAGLLYDLRVEENVLFTCRIPTGDAAPDVSPSDAFTATGPLERVAAADGLSYAAAAGSWDVVEAVQRPPAGLGWVARIPKVYESYSRSSGDLPEPLAAGGGRLAVPLREKLATFRTPIVSGPGSYATIPLPTAVPGAEGGQQIRIVGEQAVLLRQGDLFTADLAHPDRPAERLVGRWRFGRFLAAAGERAVVLAGGRSTDDPRVAVEPHLAFVQLTAWPLAEFGVSRAIDLGPRGWEPAGVAMSGERVFAAVSQRTIANGVPRHRSALHVIDASDPSAPDILATIETWGDGADDVELRAVAAAGDRVVAVGLAGPATEEQVVGAMPPLAPRGRVWLLDVRTPESPVIAASLAIPGTPSDVAIDGDDVLIASGDAGLLRLSLAPGGPPSARVWRIALPWLGTGPSWYEQMHPSGP